jgi:hypothetical protein
MYAMCTSKVSTEAAKMMFRDRQKPNFEQSIQADCAAYSKALVDFMLSLLTKSPAARPTAEQALETTKKLRAESQ